MKETNQKCHIYSSISQRSRIDELTELKADYFETESHYVAKAGLELDISQELMGQRSYFHGCSFYLESDEHILEQDHYCCATAITPQDTCGAVILTIVKCTV